MCPLRKAVPCTTEEVVSFLVQEVAERNCLDGMY